MLHLRPGRHWPLLRCGAARSGKRYITKCFAAGSAWRCAQPQSLASGFPENQSVKGSNAIYVIPCVCARAGEATRPCGRYVYHGTGSKLARDQSRRYRLARSGGEIALPDQAGSGGNRRLSLGSFVGIASWPGQRQAIWSVVLRQVFATAPREEAAALMLADAALTKAVGLGSSGAAFVRRSEAPRLAQGGRRVATGLPPGSGGLGERGGAHGF